MIYHTESGRHHTVDKKWGKEEWLVNTNKYCGKILTINKGFISSEGNFHQHLIKDETFYILSGVLMIDVMTSEDIKRSIYRRFRLRPGDSFRLLPGVWHRFYTTTSFCEFMEFSTTHRESDSIRKSFEEIVGNV